MEAPSNLQNVYFPPNFSKINENHRFNGLPGPLPVSELVVPCSHHPGIDLKPHKNHQSEHGSRSPVLDPRMGLNCVIIAYKLQIREKKMLNTWNVGFGKVVPPFLGFFLDSMVPIDSNVYCSGAPTSIGSALKSKRSCATSPCPQLAAMCSGLRSMEVMKLQPQGTESHRSLQHTTPNFLDEMTTWDENKTHFKNYIYSIAVDSIVYSCIQCIGSSIVSCHCSHSHSHSRIIRNSRSYRMKLHLNNSCSHRICSKLHREKGRHFCFTASRGSHWCTASKCRTTLRRLKWHAIPGQNSAFWPTFFGPLCCAESKKQFANSIDVSPNSSGAEWGSQFFQETGFVPSSFPGSG